MIQAFCKAAHDVDRFAPGLIGYLDCQAQTIGAQGYSALAAPGSPVSLLLTALVTLFIAFIGYRMLLGQTLNHERIPGIGWAGIALIGAGLLLYEWQALRQLRRPLIS